MYYMIVKILKGKANERENKRVFQSKPPPPKMDILVVKIDNFKLFDFSFHKG